MMKVVSVKFKSSGSTVYNSKEYYYKTFSEVKAGDIVVVDTSTVGYNVALVYDADVADPTLQKKATKYIVQVVNTEGYEAAMQRERELQAIKKQMDARVKSLQETALYELLAKDDPELGSLLMQYKDMLQGI